MKIILSQLFTLADIKLEKVLQTFVIGTVCITAIVKCGIMAVFVIALAAITKIFAEV